MDLRRCSRFRVIRHSEAQSGTGPAVQTKRLGLRPIDHPGASFRTQAARGPLRDLLLATKPGQLPPGTHLPEQTRRLGRGRRRRAAQVLPRLLRIGPTRPRMPERVSLLLRRPLVRSGSLQLGDPIRRGLLPKDHPTSAFSEQPQRRNTAAFLLGLNSGTLAIACDNPRGRLLQRREREAEVSSALRTSQSFWKSAQGRVGASSAGSRGCHGRRRN